MGKHHEIRSPCPVPVLFQMDLPLWSPRDQEVALDRLDGSWSLEHVSYIVPVYDLKPVSPSMHVYIHAYIYIYIYACIIMYILYIHIYIHYTLLLYKHVYI